MAFWTIGNLGSATRGQWLRGAPANAAAVVRGLGTDTRTVQSGQAFLALRGERFDAHDFLAKAAAAGAALLIVDQPDKAAALPDAAPPVLVVRDTLGALHDLARAYRQRLAEAGVKVVAVGGSNGKTTTRQLIHTVLSAHYRGTQSPKSFNNHIGVPLTLLAAAETDDFVVVEIGTNHPGEVAALAQIATPDVAVITSIGHEHMEFFRTLEGVAAEEATLLAHVVADSMAMVSTQALPLVQPFLKLPVGMKVVPYGDVRHDTSSSEPSPSGRGQGEGTGGRAAVSDQSKTLTPALSTRGPRERGSEAVQRFVAGGLTIELPLLGPHNAVNAAGAVAVGRALGVPDERIVAALAQATGVPMRLQVSRIPADAPPAQAVTLINDAYNANPDSMLAALQTLRAYPLTSPAGRRVLIMGDMRELGDQAPQLHRKVGEAIASAACGLASASATPDIHHAIFIGPLSMFAAEAVSRVWPPERFQSFAAWDDALPARVAATLRPGDVALIKASRGMQLERLLPAITTAFTPPDAKPPAAPRSGGTAPPSGPSEGRHPKSEILSTNAGPAA